MAADSQAFFSSWGSWQVQPLLLPTELHHQFLGAEDGVSPCFYTKCMPTNAKFTLHCTSVMLVHMQVPLVSAAEHIRSKHLTAWAKLVR